MRKKLIYMTVAALALMACQQQNSKEETESHFETMKVTKQDFTLHETYPAAIEGRQSIKIIPRVEGYLKEIRVKEGQQVKRGQVLFVIDQSFYLAEAKAAEANLAVTKAALENAQLNYDSRHHLFEKNIVSDYDLRTAASNLTMSKAQAKQAQAQLESARANLSFTVLRSPSVYLGKFHEY